MFIREFYWFVYTLTMKIGINGRFLLEPYTGIGQYTIQLLRAFAQNGSDDEYIIAVPEGASLEVLAEIDYMAKYVKVVPEITWTGKSVAKHYWEQVQIPDFFTNEKVDLVWLPYPSMRWFGAYGTAKTIVTVHDTIPWTMKKYSRNILSSLAHIMSRRSVGQADHVVTVSEASAKEIIEACQVPRENISVIWNGVADIFRKEIDPEIAKELMATFGLKEGEFFLYVGGYDARKQVKKMTESYMNFAEGAKCDYPLVLVGGKLYNDDLYSDFENSEEISHAGKIIRTGFLSDQQLATLYKLARGFVHFSEKEGFNIPLAQAIVCGLPVLASDIPVHREIAENTENVILIDIDNQENIRKGWERVNILSKIESDQDTLFSWKDSAKKHIKLFSQL